MHTLRNTKNSLQYHCATSSAFKMDVMIWLTQMLIITLGTSLTTPSEATTATVTTDGSRGMTTDASTADAGSVTPGQALPTFAVRNSKGDICMLLQFNATVELLSRTVNKEEYQVVLPVTDTSDWKASCDSNDRYFSLLYPSESTTCVEWTIVFETASDLVYVIKNDISLSFIEPCFVKNNTLYNRTFSFDLSNRYYVGTIGRTFQCESIEEDASLLLQMSSIMFQPFADKATPKGQFGQVEKCKRGLYPTRVPDPTQTDRPRVTFASPLSTGWIVGIVIGSIGVVVSTISLIVACWSKYKRGE